MTADQKTMFEEAFSEQKGFNMRRAFISTRYGIMRDLYLRLNDERSYQNFEHDRMELSSIDEEATNRFVLFRKYQTQYLVEYETEERDTVSSRLTDRRYSEQLYFFNDCEVNTFEYGWDMEDEATQDLMYEVADFILQYKTGKYLLRNIKRL